jgi:D-glycero-beta-D-manno-heptose 1-phosphate adenylyltransferase
MKKLEVIQNKIFTDPTKIKHILAIWRFKGYKIVFTNGCFDLLHLGHLDYLAKAAGKGDKLVVGLNTDSSVTRLKGPDRPITDQHSRAMILAAMNFVSMVVLFDEETPYKLITKIQPDILVKGADYNPVDIVGYNVVMAKGGKVETIEFLPGYSTSAIEAKIRNS